MGERNCYDAKDGLVEGVEGGRMRYSSEPSPPQNSTVEEPAISIAGAAQGGDVTVKNCAFVNCAQFAIQAGHRSGTFKVINNVFVASRMAALDNSRFCKDEYIKIDNNIMFGNKGGDLYYTPASNTKLHLTVDQFEDLEFESNSGNMGEAPEIGVNQAYMKGFFSARYNETTNYDPNSIENQWARALGMNQQGTMNSKVSMFMKTVLLVAVFC